MASPCPSMSSFQLLANLRSLTLSFQRKDRVARTFTTVVSWRASELHWRMFDGGGAYDALYDGEEAVWLPDQRSFQFNPFCPNLTCLAPIHVAAVHGATLGRGLQACIEINKGFLSSSELLRHPIQQTVNCGISFPL